MEGSRTPEATHTARTRRRRRRRRFLIAGAVGAAVLVVFGVALGLTLRTYEQVKGPLLTAENTLTALAHNPDSLNSALGRKQMELRLGAASRNIATAQHEIASSTGLKMLGVIPGLDTQRAGLEQLVADLHSASLTSLALLRSVNTLAAESHGTQISLPDLKSLGSELSSAQAQLTSENRPLSGLWGPIGNDRQKFDREDARATHLLRQGVELTRYALAFLGADGPRTYLVVGENNAEMRDQGAPLSYALMSTDAGSITVVNEGSIGPLELASPTPGVVVPAGTEKMFGAELDPTLFWQSANVTADFAFSGQDMQAMYATATGQHVDGVIGLDVVALQGLLSLTGPVTVAGVPEPVTAQNAGEVLLHQLYAGLPPDASQDPRHEEVGAVASAAVHQLQVGNIDVVALARTLATAISGRHMQLWDDVPSYERTLREVGASGAVDTDDPTRTFHVAVENATATKLDYYVDVAISNTVYILPNGSALVNTSVKLVNHAPAGQPPSYQLGPDDFNSKVPGEYVGRVILWSPRDSTQVGGGTPESGLVAREEDLPVFAAHTAIAQFSTTIPEAVVNGVLRLVFVPQPRLQPETVSVHVADADLKPGSPNTQTAVLTTSKTLTWYFSSTNG